MSYVTTTRVIRAVHCRTVSDANLCDCLSV